MREFFTRLAGALAVDPVPLDPAGSAAGDAVVAVAAAVTTGSLLSPSVVFRVVRGDVLRSALG